MIKTTLPDARRTMADFELGVTSAKRHFRDAYRSIELARITLDEQAAYMCPSGFDAYELPKLERTLQDIDRRAWRQLMTFTGLAKTLDAKAMQEFDRTLEENPPEFTAATALATVERLAVDADMMFARGLVNIFKKLNGKYRSHSAFRIQKRSIVRHMTSPRWGGMNHEKRDMANDLDRVLCRLTDREHTPGQLWAEWDRANTEGRDYQDNYIAVRFFQNGNAHLIINDDQLINRINDVISGWYGERAIP